MRCLAVLDSIDALTLWVTSVVAEALGSVIRCESGQESLVDRHIAQRTMPSGGHPQHVHYFCLTNGKATFSSRAYTPIAGSWVLLLHFVASFTVLTLLHFVASFTDLTLSFLQILVTIAVERYFVVCRGVRATWTRKTIGAWTPLSRKNFTTPFLKGGWCRITSWLPS